MLMQGLTTTIFLMREWEILIYLEQHGQATASELADAFMVTRTLISRNTWRLIQDNLIQSQVNQTDRRIALMLDLGTDFSRPCSTYKNTQKSRRFKLKSGF
nr:MarR family transcriptional regulator [Weissella confusa]